MGTSGSKSRGLWLFGSGGPGSSERSTGDQTLARARGLCSATPFVFTRRGSMYYDEDGDLAHEFYEETIITKNGRKRAKLKRIHKNLTPQGMVKLEHPRIHVDFPVIICEVAADVKCLDTRGPTCTFLGTDILRDYPQSAFTKVDTFQPISSREGNFIAMKQEHPADRDEFANLLDQRIRHLTAMVHNEP